MVDIGVSGGVGVCAGDAHSSDSAGNCMAGLIASSLRAFSPRCFAHLRAAATRRAQWTEQKRPDPYVSSCVSPQLSHEAPGRETRFARDFGMCESAFANGFGFDSAVARMTEIAGTGIDLVCAASCGRHADPNVEVNARVVSDAGSGLGEGISVDEGAAKASETVADFLDSLFSSDNRHLAAGDADDDAAGMGLVGAADEAVVLGGGLPSGPTVAGGASEEADDMAAAAAWIELHFLRAPVRFAHAALQYRPDA
jgi:hypothetical protein